MTLAVLLGMHWAPDFTKAALASRILWLGLLVAGGVAVYGLAMLVMGFRLRELREH